MILLIRKPIEILLIIGTVSLIYFQKITDSGELTTTSVKYRSDFVFLLAVLLFWGAVSMKFLMGRIKYIDKNLAIISGLLMAFFACCLFATVMSYFTIDLIFNQAGFATLGKMLLGISLIITLWAFVRYNKDFYRYISIALYLPPVLPILMGLFFFISPALFFSIFGEIDFIVQQFSMLTIGARFEGITSNPFQVVFNSIVSISFLWVGFLWAIMKKKNFFAMLALIFTLINIGGIYWTAVRSAFIALLFVLSFTSIATFYVFRKNINYTLKILFFSISLSLSLFFFLPSQLTDVLMLRSQEDSGRLHLWRHFLPICLDHPLGIGFNFDQRFNYPSPHPDRADYPPHNVFLTAWMLGGIGGVFFMSAFVWIMFKQIFINIYKIRIRGPSINDLHFIAAAGSFFSLWLLSFFLGVIITDFTHSIVCALVLAGLYGRSNETKSGV